MQKLRLLVNIYFVFLFKDKLLNGIVLDFAHVSDIDTTTVQVRSTSNEKKYHSVVVVLKQIINCHDDNDDSEE